MQTATATIPMPAPTQAPRQPAFTAKAIDAAKVYGSGDTTVRARSTG